MKTKTTKLLLSLVVLLAFSRPAQATIIVALEPSSQTINPGDPVSLTLVASGLGDHTAPSLAGFAFDLTFDPAILSAVSVAFGSQLDLGIVGSLRFSDLTTPGAIHLDEVS